MEINYLLSAPLLIIASIIAFGTLFYWIPLTFSSIARHKLWEARDQIYIDRMQGKLSDKKEIGELIEFTEWLIDNIREHNMASAFTLRWRAKKVIHEHSKRYWAELKNGLNDEQMKLIESYRQTVNTALTIRLWLGSASGLCATVIVLIPVVIWILIDHRRRSVHASVTNFTHDVGDKYRAETERKIASWEDVPASWLSRAA